MRKFVAIFLLSVLFTHTALAQYKSPEEIPVELFGALPKNSQVDLSPDGKHFSIVSFIDGTRYVVITPVGGKPLTVIPPYKDMAVYGAFWANNETILITMGGEKEAHSAFGKVNAGRTISYNIKTDKTRDMQRPAKVPGSAQRRTYMADSAALIDWLPDDPDHILLAIDEDGTDAAREVRKVDVTSGKYTLEMDFYGPAQFWVTDRQDVIRYGRGVERKDRSAEGDIRVLHYLNPETGNFDRYDLDPEAKFGVWAFFEDPRYAYVTDLNEDGNVVLYKWDMVNWQAVETIFEVEGGNVQRLVEDIFTEEPVGVQYDLGGPHIHYFDENFAKIQRMLGKALPDNVITLTSYNRDKNLFVVNARSDIDPGAYYLFDYENKNLIFMEGAYEGLDPRLMSPMQDVSYQARDGLEIPAYLTVPMGSDGKNLPTVILPHGGPEARDFWGYDFIVQFLASRGYAVLQPQFRGSGGFTQDFADAGRKQWGEKMQDDVTDGALWMIEQGIADPERMCIMGWSYGGYVAMTATFNTPDLYKCSISVNGVSDLPKILYQDSNFVGSSYWKRHIGEDKEKNKQNSAIHNIDKIRMPVLVIANRDDTSVDYKQSTSFVDEMRDAGKNVTYFEIEEGGHSALEGEGRVIILREAEKFLRRHIGK